MPAGRGVVNTTSSVAHVYTSGSSTACGMWCCGSPSEPASNAEFSTESAPLDLPLAASRCKKCFSAKLLEAWRLREEEDVPTLADEGVASSEAESDEEPLQDAFDFGQTEEPSTARSSTD